jgi:hypothetical protein
MGQISQQRDQLGFSLLLRSVTFSPFVPAYVHIYFWKGRTLSAKFFFGATLIVLALLFKAGFKIVNIDRFL